MIEIKHRYTDAVLFRSETATTTAEALAEAVKARANLAGANLAGAYLADADLAGANLARANLAGADLADAYLAGADLADADLAGANLADARGLPTPGQLAKERAPVPVISNIHSRLLAAVTAEGCRLDMSKWHTCETTHCRAGWIVALAGEAGKTLEAEAGTAHAAAMIYRKSDPGFRVPHWYAENEDAMADIRRCAEEEQAREVEAK